MRKVSWIYHSSKLIGLSMCWLLLYMWIIISFSYFKFGAMGTVTGHELTHGFDNHGLSSICNRLYLLLLYVLYRSIVQWEWYSHSMVDHCLTTTVWSEKELFRWSIFDLLDTISTGSHNMCIVEIKSLSLQVDGQQTLGENIADNGGLKTAFQVL